MLQRLRYENERKKVDYTEARELVNSTAYQQLKFAINSLKSNKAMMLGQHLCIDLKNVNLMHILMSRCVVSVCVCVCRHATIAMTHVHMCPCVLMENGGYKIINKPGSHVHLSKKLLPWSRNAILKSCLGL